MMGKMIPEDNPQDDTDHKKEIQKTNRASNRNRRRKRFYSGRSQTGSRRIQTQESTEAGRNHQ